MDQTIRPRADSRDEQPKALLQYMQKQNQSRSESKPTAAMTNVTIFSQLRRKLKELDSSSSEEAEENVADTSGLPSAFIKPILTGTET